MYETLVEKFRDKGAAGATVCRAMRGFGQSGVMHPQGRLRLSRDLPMIITVVDTSEGIARLLPLIDDMVASGIAVIINVDEASATESQAWRARTERPSRKDS
ncbi:MAG: DUF190 domain-containing protein [Acidobacteria bacterium]|nr:DUF190 domain-containing protein [Acidobacteriota bacterium]